MRTFLMVTPIIVGCMIANVFCGETPREFTVEEMQQAVNEDRLIKDGVRYSLTYSPSFGNLLTGGGINVGTVLADGTIVDSYNQKKVVGHLSEYIAAEGEYFENKYSTPNENGFYIGQGIDGSDRLYVADPSGDKKEEIGRIARDGTLLGDLDLRIMARTVVGHITEYIPEWESQ